MQNNKNNRLSSTTILLDILRGRNAQHVLSEKSKRDVKNSLIRGLHIIFKYTCIYSRLSLSRTRLSRITTYLEVKIWSLFQHRDLPTGNKILWKRGEIAPRSNFSSFPKYFHYISNLRVKLKIHSVKGGCSINCFP